MNKTSNEGIIPFMSMNQICLVTILYLQSTNKKVRNVQVILSRNIQELHWSKQPGTSWPLASQFWFHWHLGIWSWLIWSTKELVACMESEPRRSQPTIPALGQSSIDNPCWLGQLLETRARNWRSPSLILEERSKCPWWSSSTPHSVQ